MTSLVTLETIQEIWSRVCGLEEEQTRALVHEFMAWQPALGGYLLACEAALGAVAKNSPLIDLALVAWQALTRTHGAPLKPVGPKAVLKTVETNRRALESIRSASEIELPDIVNGFYLGHNQRHLLAFCVREIMEKDEAGPALEPERLCLELFWLKTIIDCLDQ